MATFELHPARERFLPLRPAELVARLLRDARLEAGERDALGRLAEMLASRLHFESRREAERLRGLYDRFDPDRDTLPPAPLAPAQAQRCRTELTAAFRKLLADSHYAELPRHKIVELVELQNFSGIKVEADLNDYRDLAVFYRGAEPGQTSRRTWRKAWRKQARACTIFRRAAVLVRTTAHEDHMHLKLFKDVIAEDLEMVLPEVRVRMRWLDGLKIGSGVAGSLATAVWKVLTEALLSTALFLIMLATFLGAILRAFLAYIGHRARYMQVLSANLYFRNLANNSGVLTYLVDAAEAEELKEMLLAYFLLYVERERDYTVDALQERARQWVRAELGVPLDFEARQAAEMLVRKGLAVYRVASRGVPASAEPAGAAGPLGSPVLKVYDLPSALRRLDRAWDAFYTNTSEPCPPADRLADAAWPAAAPPAQP
jgi:hypothetical protein